jgi:DNA-binding SARP family transcriptional activator
MADRRTQPAHPLLQVWLFGSARFGAAGRPCRFSARPKALPLLARLLLTSGPLSRDEVAFTLWPDEPEENARTNLRRHLNHIAVALRRRDPP